MTERCIGLPELKVRILSNWLLKSSWKPAMVLTTIIPTSKNFPPGLVKSLATVKDPVLIAGSYLRSCYLIFNRPGVAGAVL